MSNRWSKVVLLVAAVCLCPELLKSQATTPVAPFYKRLAGLAVGGGGVMYSLSEDGSVYGWNGQDWNLLDGKLVQIAAGSKTELWGINAENQVWRADVNGWKKMPGQMRRVAVSRGGAVVLALDLQGQAHRWQGTVWEPIASSPTLTEIAIGRPEQIYGLGTMGEIYRWKSQSGQWIKLKGRLKTISVGSDGTVAGTDPNGAAQVRTDADVQAEVNNPTVSPNWFTSSGNFTIVSAVDSSALMIVDRQGMLAQSGAPWNVPSSGTGQIVVESQLVVSAMPPPTDSFYESDLKIGDWNTGTKPVVTVSNCAILSGTLKLTNGQQVPTAGAGSICKKAAFPKIAATPQVTPNAQPSRFDVILANKLAGSSAASSYGWVATEASVLNQQGPISCEPRTFRSVSNHSWVEFALPAGVQGQNISIPSGAYNNYVFPACNRVWWENLAFSCDRGSGWKLAQGKYDADALCHGTPGSSPYVKVGTR